MWRSGWKRGIDMERASLKYLKWGMVFAFLNIHIGTLNLLPDFAGMLLFYASIRSHARQTQPEQRLRPLLLVLAADYFLHWIWPFENGLEGLLMLVISIYTIYVLLGEVAGRIKEHQPDSAKRICFLRGWAILLQMAAFFLSPYEYGTVDGVIGTAMVMMWIGLMVVISGISPEDIMERNLW